MPSDLDLLNQRVDELDGSRRQTSIGRAAVRLDDLNGLLQLPDTLKSAHAAGSTPTAAEYNKLVDDLAEMNRRLLSVVGVIRGRRGR